MEKYEDDLFSLGTHQPLGRFFHPLDHESIESSIVRQIPLPETEEVGFIVESNADKLVRPWDG